MEQTTTIILDMDATTVQHALMALIRHISHHAPHYDEMTGTDDTYYNIALDILCDCLESTYKK